MCDVRVHPIELLNSETCPTSALSEHYILALRSPPQRRGIGARSSTSVISGNGGCGTAARRAVTAPYVLIRLIGADCRIWSVSAGHWWSASLVIDRRSPLRCFTSQASIAMMSDCTLREFSFSRYSKSQHSVNCSIQSRDFHQCDRVETLHRFVAHSSRRQRSISVWKQHNFLRTKGLFRNLNPASELGGGC